MAKRRRVVKWVLLAIGLSFLLAMGVMFWLARTPPKYWQPREQVTEVQLEQMDEVGSQLENRVNTERTKVRADGEIWTFTTTQDEVNAWITARLPKWLRNQRKWLADHNLPSRIPSEFKQIMVGLTPKYAALAAEVEQDGKKQIMSFEFTPFKGPTGVMRTRLKSIKGGRLPLPRALVEAMVAKFGSEEDARSEAVAKASEKLAETDLIIPVGDGRTIHILDVKLAEGVITLTCQSFSAKADE